MKSESILLITSAQNDLLDPAGGAWGFVRATVEKNRVPQKLIELTRAARASGIPVIHSPIELDYPSMTGFKPLSAIQQVVFDNRLLAKGTWGSGFLAGLNVGSQDSVLRPRQGFSSFWAKTIQSELERLGARTIYIAGMLAEACVESHARDAIENGYRPIVISDAIGATSTGLLEASLQTLTLHSSAMFTTEQAIVSWRK
ncbi:MAG TPA: cysteine hydrolase [Candidatus Limnocylindria bacterium]|nr:cysteine hydrolase [Candidatus Limnocylindria bacterium]